DDYDHRFFYIKNNNRCYYICGFVRDCMANYLFEKGRMEVFTNPTWIYCIKEFKNNPSVKGFIVEKACLASIFKNGLVGYVQFIYHIFGTKSRLMDYWLNRDSTLYIAPIQIALNKKMHSDSEATFFSGIWPELKIKVQSSLDVKVIFIWITCKNDANNFVEANERRLREKKIEINPQYDVVVTEFNNVNINLGFLLSM
ncbi:13216_t:CDS:2, partial [Funneliformis caledonium]